jgi:hypothetical protein
VLGTWHGAERLAIEEARGAAELDSRRWRGAAKALVASVRHRGARARRTFTATA